MQDADYVREIPQTQVIFWQRWGAAWPIHAYFISEDPFRFSTPCWDRSVDACDCNLI